MTNTVANRQAGILLHPTSLPTKYGIGELGKEAYRFVDFLSRSQQRLWQILPLSPVGYGESPYQSFSAFAGNPILISIERLFKEGLLSRAEVANPPKFSESRVDFAGVKEYKGQLLQKAFQQFKRKVVPDDYASFIEENSVWLENYSLFMALKGHFNGVAWNFWDSEIAFRHQGAIIYYQNVLADQIEYHKFLQYTFFAQWKSLKGYANDRGIRIIGDLPIFISYDSSDAWANPELFALDGQGNPAKVAGVPPDYFSSTGQLWGNPHYQWDEMKKNDFKWWRQRVKSLLSFVDIVRIDHFRGFEAYWEVEGGSETAVDGRWAKGPNDHFFTTVEKYLGELPVIAEDLGIITPEVDRLRKRFNYPGMKVLHFTFEGGAKELFLSLFEKDRVIYTGTHDNDTTLGWYKKAVAANSKMVKLAEKYFQISPLMSDEEICWRFIKIAYQASARKAIIPLQDILCLDSDARMNYPGIIDGNWQWRFTNDAISTKMEEKLAELVTTSGR